VVVLDSVITHTSAWFLDRGIDQLVMVSFCKEQTLTSGVARLSWLPGLSEVITRLYAKHVVVRGHAPEWI